VNADNNIASCYHTINKDVIFYYYLFTLIYISVNKGVCYLRVCLFTWRDFKCVGIYSTSGKFTPTQIQYKFVAFVYLGPENLLQP